MLETVAMPSAAALALQTDSVRPLILLYDPGLRARNL